MNSRTLTPFLVSVMLGFGLATTVPSARAERSAPIPLVSLDDARAAVLAEVGRQLSDHFRVEGELQLEAVRPLVLPSASPSFTLELAEFPSALASSLLVRVRVAGDGLPATDQTLVVRAQLLRDAWVARAPLDRDAAFDAAQLDTRRVDVLRERDAVPASEVCADYSFVRAVPAGRILTWRDVARRALVRKGQLIEVAAVDGSLSITMKALAMENGAAGEMVKVRNLDSKKEFNALVVSDSRAQVRF